MKIYQCTGYEYEKSLKTSPEDFFNYSEVVYDHEGKKRTLSVTYVRYFEELLAEKEIYNAEEKEVPFYEIAALLILMKNEGYVEARRLYYSDTQQFLDAFEQEQIDEALSIYHSVQH